jgi:uncharacterized protein with HEPN domain
MHSKEVQAALLDIRDNIQLARNFVAGCDFETFRQDRKTFYATTRCLEIISEASRRLPAEMKARHSTVEWQRIAGSGNIYRHNYDNVAEHLVWDTVHRALPILEAIIDVELTPR